jgi:two-component system, NarL family, response regulator DevR
VEILRAVHTLLRGEGVFDSPRPSSVVVDVLREQAPVRPQGFTAAALTERENQVLRLLATGLSNREIALRLMISEATVKFHVRNLRDKLEVRRRTEIVYTAMRHGMV